MADAASARCTERPRIASARRNELRADVDSGRVWRALDIREHPDVGLEDDLQTLVLAGAAAFLVGDLARRREQDRHGSAEFRKGRRAFALARQRQAKEAARLRGGVVALAQRARPLLRRRAEHREGGIGAAVAVERDPVREVAAQNLAAELGAKAGRVAVDTVEGGQRVLEPAAAQLRARRDLGGRERAGSSSGP